MQFVLGQTVGDYEILDIVERSKEGVAYRVRNVVAQRFEMLKVLPKHLQEDSERVERFVREIKVHARLSHPNIVSFYNATQLEGQLIMTTELVEGVTLAQALQSGPLPVEQALGHILQVLDALAYAHQHDVVHREVTPANIILTPDGTVKLTGFGLAKAATDSQLTRVGSVLGSLEYMSPEQVKGAGALDGRTDIYSLGAVLYETVTGKTPFHTESQFDLMVAHVSKAPAPPSEMNAALSPELDRVILKALAKDPAHRFQTAKELRDALQELQPAAVEAPKNVAHAASLPPLAAAVGGTPLHPEPAATLDPKSAAWRPTPELVAAGVFTFLLVAVAFFALLTMTRG